jgi:hypothetical protein
MGMAFPEMTPADDNFAEALLGSLRTISPGERRKHASVYNYWLAIRGDKQFPPIRDLDPLEISDAGAFSLLLEMIGGGEDAEIRHLGQALKDGADVERVGEAPNPSLLSCIATRLPVVAACRDAFAFEDSFDTPSGKRRCWVTLLPFSATGTWIDFVYGFVSLDSNGSSDEAEQDTVDASTEETLEVVEDLPEPIEPVQEEAVSPVDVGKEESLELTEISEDLPDQDVVADVAEPGFAPEPPALADTSPAATRKTAVSARFFDNPANPGGYYGRPAEITLDLDTVEFETGGPDVAETPTEPQSTPEGTLQSKLTEVRAKADEARAAKLRANAALYEGLSAAYDFALDAEGSPEEYLRLVESEGLKIQLRAPMKPVAKLAFDGMCDDTTIEQLEAVLSWAFAEELPRGSLAARIEEAGGIGPILTGQVKAAA